MDELIARVTETAGVDAATARRVVEIELAFLKDQGDKAKVNELIAAMPGAQQVALPDEGSFSGMMGAMSAFGKLQSTGLDMTGIRTVTKEILAYAREHAGTELVDDVVRSVPMLSQVI